MSTAYSANIASDIAKLRNEKERLDAYTRLTVNPDFRRLIQEFYLTDYAVSLVHAKSNLNNTDILKEEIEKNLLAIAFFNRFLQDLQVSSETIEDRLKEALSLI